MPAGKHPVARIWRAKDGWRWRLASKNGASIAESGEAYTRRRDCVIALDKVRVAIRGPFETRVLRADGTLDRAASAAATQA